jgi:hypothetical protein
MSTCRTRLDRDDVRHTIPVSRHFSRHYNFGRAVPAFIAAIRWTQIFSPEASPVGVRDQGEIEHAVDVFARSPNGGLIVTASAPAAVHRELIVSLAARHKLPAVYAFRFYANSGGLMSYGPNTIEPYVRSAEYTDRILKGENLLIFLSSAHAVRAGAQPQNRSRPRPHSYCYAARPRQGDRVTLAKCPVV